MQALAALQALHRNAGARALGQAVDVQGLDAQELFDLVAHALGPGLGAEEAHAQLEVGKVHLLVADGLAHHQRVGGGAGDGVAAQVLHEHELALGVAGGGGHDGRADLLHAVMEPQAAGEQAVAVGDLHGVVLRHARAAKAAGHALGPHLDVALGVAGDDGLAGRAGGGVDAHDLRAGRGKGAVRVVVAQVALIHEGQELQVRKGADVLGLYALLLHPLAVEGDVGVHAVDGLLQPLELNALQRLAVDGFHGTIPVHRHNLQMWFRKNACIFANCFSIGS